MDGLFKKHWSCNGFTFSLNWQLFSSASKYAIVSAKFSKDKTSFLALKSSYYPNSLPHTKVFKRYLFYDLKIFMVRQCNDTDDIGIDERQTLCYLFVALKDSRFSVTQGCRGVYTPRQRQGTSKLELYIQFMNDKQVGLGRFHWAPCGLANLNSSVIEETDFDKF